MRFGLGESDGHGARHIADIHRLEARLRTRHRQHRQEARHRGEAVEELVLGTEHHRGAEHRGLQVFGIEHRLLALRFRALILRRRIVRRAERAHVQQALHAGGAAGGNHRQRQLDVRAREIAMQDADEVDERVLPAYQALEHIAPVDVRLDDVDRGQQDEMLGALAAPRRHRDLDAAPHELGDEMAAYKA